MEIIKKILISIFTLLLLELIIFFQNSVKLMVLFFVLIIVLSLFATLKLKLIHKIGFIAQVAISMLPVIYIISVASFLIFVPADFYLQHVYCAFAVIFYYLLISFVFKKIYNEFLQPVNKKKSYIGDLIINISAFLLYGSVLGLYLYFSWPIWILMLVLIFSTFLLTYEFFWFNKLLKKHIVFALILALINSEICWVVSLWPTGFISRSIIIFTVFYVFTGLSKHSLTNTLSKKTIRNYLIIGILILLLVLLTTKWTY